MGTERTTPVCMDVYTLIIVLDGFEKSWARFFQGGLENKCI
jgi:hypothetical protein